MSWTRGSNGTGTTEMRLCEERFKRGEWRRMVETVVKQEQLEWRTRDGGVETDGGESSKTGTVGVENERWGSGDGWWRE